MPRDTSARCARLHERACSTPCACRASADFSPPRAAIFADADAMPPLFWCRMLFIDTPRLDFAIRISLRAASQPLPHSFEFNILCLLFLSHYFTRQLLFHFITALQPLQFLLRQVTSSFSDHFYASWVTGRISLMQHYLPVTGPSPLSPLRSLFKDSGIFIGVHSDKEPEVSREEEIVSQRWIISLSIFITLPRALFRHCHCHAFIFQFSEAIYYAATILRWFFDYFRHWFPLLPPYWCLHISSLLPHFRHFS